MMMASLILSMPKDVSPVSAVHCARVVSALARDAGLSSRLARCTAVAAVSRALPISFIFAPSSSWRKASATSTSALTSFTGSSCSLRTGITCSMAWRTYRALSAEGLRLRDSAASSRASACWSGRPSRRLWACSANFSASSGLSCSRSAWPDTFSASAWLQRDPSCSKSSAASPAALSASRGLLNMSCSSAMSMRAAASSLAMPPIARRR
mmetsp:Transcript_11472/g.33594  ORF Transcript_11472/g.33594 Transcript_11472/m.33594 type:complete len:210 (+) Transcript_11472:153-782(+)